MNISDIFATSSSISSSYNIIVPAAVLLVSCFVFVFSKKSKRPNLPPGPPGWPVVGNLFQVAGSGKSFFDYVKDLRKTYGDIFTLQMGSTTMIIVTDPKLVHEALVERGTLFATRAAENPTRRIFSSNKFTVNAALYGPEWRSLRRNMVQNMLSSTRVREFRSVRDRAMDTLINRIRVEADAEDGAVWVVKNARFAVFCILLVMCFGLEMDDEEIKQMDDTMKSVLVTLNPRIDDYLPILSPFFSKQRKEALRVRNNQVDFIAKIIDRRRRALKNPGSDEKATSFSYLDTLFDLKIEGRKATPSDPELVSLCSEFLNGGTDTTATAVEWGIAQMIVNPHVQDKLYEEIRSVVGDKKVDEKDTDKMPYLQAVVREILRLHPPTYFLLSHAVTEPTTLGGYDVPVGVNVEIYSKGIGEDPKTWSDPERFDPERFFAGKKEDVDITGNKEVTMIPFGAGRRICPGLAMGTVHIHLMLARMVQEFEWRAVAPDAKIDFTGKLEFTVVMKSSLRAKVRPRT